MIIFMEYERTATVLGQCMPWKTIAAYTVLDDIENWDLPDAHKTSTHFSCSFGYRKRGNDRRDKEEESKNLVDCDTLLSRYLPKA